MVASSSAPTNLTLSDYLAYGSYVGPSDVSANLELIGINHRQIPRPVPINKERMGYVFFSRPAMNMSSANFAGIPELAPIYNTENPISLKRYIRHMLDPRLTQNTGVKCPLLIDDLGLIPLFTNFLESLSGAPEPSIDIWTSQPNQYGGVFSMADGHCKTYGQFTVSTSFRNMPGSPILDMARLWTSYQAYVHDGQMSPHPDMLVQNEVDSQVGIYIFKMDHTNRFVTHMTWIPVAHPINPPTSAYADYNNKDVYNDAHHTLNIQWNCIGVYYDHPIIFWAFNRLITSFCPSMADGAREKAFIQLDGDDLVTFNNVGYPRVNYKTNELEWWVRNADYAAVKNMQAAFSYSTK
ncbi:MAG: hypothetical protein ACKO0Z_03440 [Betaproteobacteria bacterium]